MDPFATGLLLIGVGKGATRELNAPFYQQEALKTYEFIARFGQYTESFDCYSPILHFAVDSTKPREIKQALENLTIEKVKKVSEKLIGEKVQQRAPLYSAKREKGTRFYDILEEKMLKVRKELAAQALELKNQEFKKQQEKEFQLEQADENDGFGKDDIEKTKPKKKRIVSSYKRNTSLFPTVEELKAAHSLVPFYTVSIHTLDLLELVQKQEDFIDIKFRTIVSKGTYIRSITFGMGEELGVGAHTVELTRTKVGNITLQDAWNLDLILSKLVDPLS